MDRRLKTDDIDLVVLDLDGTLYQAGRAIPGASETVAAIRGSGISLRFVTNTFASPATKILERLEGFGIQIDTDELITPHETLAAFFADRPNAQCSVFADPDLLLRMKYLPKPVMRDPDIVLVVDSGELWSYGSFDRLLGYLSDGADFLASSATSSFIGRDGKPHPDTGALVALLESASGKKARIMGKPGEDMARYVISKTGHDPLKTLVIGDDPAIDIAFAKTAQAKSALVRTGKRKNGKHEPEPDFVMDSIVDLRKLLSI